MIFGGSHYTFGTLLEEDDIPLNLRKSKYLLQPDEGDDTLSELEEVGQDEFFDDDLTINEEEFEPPPPPIKRYAVKKKK